MSQARRRNLISDVPGLAVGNAEHDGWATGVTVILPERPAAAGVDVRGGGPGTRESDLLDPAAKVDRIDALVFSGGSAFGLKAGDGVMSWLAERGRGFPTAGGWRVPIVPGAIIYDLPMDGAGDATAMPHDVLARQACDTASTEFDLGSVGAGTGARAGRLKGGLGSVSAALPDGAMVGALVVANPVGSVVMPGRGTFWAWALEQAGELGHQVPPGAGAVADFDLPPESRLRGNTTLAVIATDIDFEKSDLKRIAIMAQDGLARAIRPVHTPFDGDIVYAMSTGRREPGDPEMTVARVGAAAADCVARAAARGVFEAIAPAGALYPAYRQVHTTHRRFWTVIQTWTCPRACSRHRRPALQAPWRRCGSWP
jgi:L-aminopeptidase/D-esterase-like protein